MSDILGFNKYFAGDISGEENVRYLEDKSGEDINGLEVRQNDLRLESSRLGISTSEGLALNRGNTLFGSTVN